VGGGAPPACRRRQLRRHRQGFQRWPRHHLPARRREGWDAPAAISAPIVRAQPAASLPNDILQARRSLSRRILRILDLDLKIMERRMQKRLEAADDKNAEPEGMSDGCP
jgi:hypothetical protein